MGLKKPLYRTKPEAVRVAAKEQESPLVRQAAEAANKVFEVDEIHGDTVQSGHRPSRMILWLFDKSHAASVGSPSVW